MTNKPEHIKFPLETHTGEDYVVIMNAGGHTDDPLATIYGETLDDATEVAELFTRACNSHYDLIEVLEKILDEPFTNPSTVKRARNIIERARGEA